MGTKYSLKGDSGPTDGSSLAGLAEAQDHGNMYIHENGVPTVIDEQSVEHAVFGFTQGVLTNWTFKEGKTIAISEFQTSDGGTKTKCLSGAAGLANGDIVTIANTTNYDGIYVIEQVVASTSFVIAIGFEANDGIQTGRAASYLAHATYSDTVRVWMRLNLTPAGANDVFEGACYNGLTKIPDTEDQLKLGGVGDYHSLNSFTAFEYTAGNKIWVSIMNNSASANLTIRNANIEVQSLH